MTDRFFSMLEFACKFEDLENKGVGGGQKNPSQLCIFFFLKIPGLQVGIVYPTHDCKAVMSIQSSPA